MHEFLILLNKIYPLYLMVLAGYAAGKLLKVDRHTVSSLLIFIIAPIVVFNGVATALQSTGYLFLPVLFFTVAVLLSIVFFAVGGKFWQTSERNLLSFVAGSGNTGYFGIPLILSLYGQKGLSVAAFATLGLILFESTRGYYIMAKSHAHMRDALIKVVKLPVLYAFAAGLLVNTLSINLPEPVRNSFTYFNGAYTVLGMMILGIGLAGVTRATFDKTFTLLSFMAKFVCYPLLIGLFVYLDKQYFHLYSSEVHSIILILSVVPMATNTVTYATQLKTHPEKAAFSVLLSTLFALIYIPLFIAVFLS